ncbi:MAG TPA: chitobiase/beta-hexosaminidase C-terminal domain-containing protein [Treponemataceae bacterium]|nr:chitobiase/beta-hexosaminidase C-terminal domain-containing protein [Treponemataceae bacterium]
MRKDAMCRAVFGALLLTMMAFSCKMPDDATNASGATDGTYSDGNGFNLTVSDGKVVHIRCTVSRNMTAVTIETSPNWTISDGEISNHTLPASSLGNMTIHGSFSGNTVTLSYTLSGGGSGYLSGTLGTQPGEQPGEQPTAPTVTITILEETAGFARVSLSNSAGVNASTYYSIDGSNITTSSLRYSDGEQIVIAKNCTLKAAAYQYSFGETASREFTFATATTAPSGAEWARTFGAADIGEAGSQLIAMNDGTFRMALFGQASTLGSDFTYQGTHSVNLPESTPWTCYFIHRAADGRVFKAYYKFNYENYNAAVPLAIVGYAADGSQTFARQYSILRVNPATIAYYQPGAFVSNADGSFALAFGHNAEDSSGNNVALLECASDGSPVSFTMYDTPESCVNVTSLTKVGDEYVLIAEETRGSITEALTLNVARISATDHSVIRWARIPVGVQPGNGNPSSSKWLPGASGAGTLFYSSNYDSIATVLNLDTTLNVVSSWFWDSVYAPAATRLASGDIVVGGAWRSVSGSYDSDLALIRLSSAGLSPVWSKRYGGTFSETLERGSLLALSGGGFLVSGRTFSFGCGNYDEWLLRLPDNGGTAALSTAALRWAVDITPEAAAVSAPVSADITPDITGSALSVADLTSGMDPAPVYTDETASLVIMSQL